MECEGRRSQSPPPPPEPETVPTSPPAAAGPSPSTAPALPFARDPGSSEPMPSSDDPDVDAETDTGTAAHGPQEPAAEEAAAAPPAATVLTNDLRYNIVTQNNKVIHSVDDLDIDAKIDIGTTSQDPQVPGVREVLPLPPAIFLTDDLLDKLVSQNDNVISPVDDPDVDVEFDPGAASHDTQVPGGGEVLPPSTATVLTDVDVEIDPDATSHDTQVPGGGEVLPPSAATVLTDVDVEINPGAASHDTQVPVSGEVSPPSTATVLTDVDVEIDPGAASHDTQVPGSGEVSPPSTATVLTDDLRDKIVAQVEYYFSDTNLPTDKFLLKYVKRDKHGFVPIGVISSFRKMKKLVQDISLIATALRTSSQLVVNANGTKVKRLLPLPESDVKDNQRLISQPCTVIVENLPGNYSKDSIQRLFGSIGNISNIAIHDPHSADESTPRKGEIAISSKIHALVEYETVEAAEKAVASLNDEKNWSGMRVELLLKRMKKYGLIQRGHKENLSEKGDNQTPDVGMDGQMTNSVDRQGETVQAEDSSGGKSRRQSRYRSRGRGQQNSNGQDHGHVHSNCIGEGTSKVIAGPKMPDGTRGFTMGRGKPAANSKNIELL